ncbi:hypothetical protein BK660_21940 [Pseudomonas brassicacearum]|uniref:Uncharacterized protein n=1 Tax=Pseudomonas brassicacearum TaxID=930166 RepID=A0A423HXP5_9PSED|nr:hypothetical protein [Pseudomonas brassicacearum]RON17953.1 hypothetical protein BK660_21940 [Pseudomonas brassicacearum]
MAEGLGGLLDFAQTPMGMGLLSAAFGGLATAGRGGPINTLGAAGLSGIAGYSAAGANALKQQKADMLRRQAQTIPTLYGQDADGNATFDWKSAAALGVDPENIAKYAQLPNAGKSKVARTVDVPGEGGNKQTMQYDEYGQPVGQAINSYVAPQLVDTGATKQFAVPTAGQSFNVTMSPAEQAANARGWANVGVKQQQNGIMQETNAINKQGQRTQVVQDGAGNFMLIDKGTGAITPATTQAGGKIQGGSLAESLVKNQQNAQKLNPLIDQALAILPSATASGIGDWRDTANRFIGKTTPSAQAAAKLAAIGGNMLMMMPRMEGPQSDRDVENYKQMVGKVGDPTVPAEERAAALSALKEIIGRYSGQPQQQPVQPPASAPIVAAPAAGPFTDPNKEARYQEFKRRQGQ